MNNCTNKKNLAVITVIGKDRVGIVAEVTSFLAKNEINIEEISQNIMKDIFTMVILVNLTNSKLPVAELAKKMRKLGKKIQNDIHVHDEKIINAMHRI